MDDIVAIRPGPGEGKPEERAEKPGRHMRLRLCRPSRRTFRRRSVTRTAVRTKIETTTKLPGDSGRAACSASVPGRCIPARQGAHAKADKHAAGEENQHQTGKRKAIREGLRSPRSHLLTSAQQRHKCRADDLPSRNVTRQLTVPPRDLAHHSPGCRRPRNLPRCLFASYLPATSDHPWTAAAYHGKGVGGLCMAIIVS